MLPVTTVEVVVVISKGGSNKQGCPAGLVPPEVGEGILPRIVRRGARRVRREASLKSIRLESQAAWQTRVERPNPAGPKLSRMVREKRGEKQESTAVVIAMFTNENLQER